MILASHGIIGSSIVQGFDLDAQAFFDRVTAAGGTLSETEQTAVNQLVLDMKNDGIWTKMKAIYPMVGASAAACAQNLKSSSFTGTFTAGFTFSSTGVLSNGSSDYMNTNFIPSTNSLAYNNNHISFYSRTSAASSASQFYEMGSGSNNLATDNYALFLRRAANNAAYDCAGFPENRLAFTNTNASGFYVGSGLVSTGKIFKNKVSQASVTLTNKSISTKNVYICAFNENDLVVYYSNKECAFASMGDGLTDTEASDFYDAVQAFQTTLSRQV
jgi:hypothetical protein